MTWDFENDDVIELVTKWLEKEPNPELFFLKVKDNAPEKFKKLFLKEKERLLRR